MTQAVRDEIAARVSALFEEYVGKAPTRAVTYMHEDLVLVVLEDTLTKGERVLAEDDSVPLVQEMRRTITGTMRDRFRQIVEEHTGRSVEATLGDHSVLPDYACAAFLLERGSNGDVRSGDADGPRVNGDRELQSEISRGFTALYKEAVGRGPTDVRSYLSEDTVVVLLTGTLTKVERTLAGEDRPISVEGMRREFQGAISGRARELVEKATGRSAVAFMSDHSVAPDYAIEVILLAGEHWGERRAEPSSA